METGDKKLNEVTKVTDMAYVPVIMADGSIGQIAKSDLASVVAGVMGNPIGTIGQDLGDNIDLNTIVKSGLYSTLSSQNQPEGYEEWYGLLSVSKFRTGEVIQTWTPNGTSSNGLFERKKNYNSNAWSPWQRIDNFGYNSLAELAGGVASEIGAKRTALTNGLYKCSEQAKIYRSCLFELCGRTGSNSQISHLYIASQDSNIFVVKGPANVNSYENCNVKIYKDSQGYIYIKGNSSYNVSVRSCYSDAYFYKVSEIDETTLTEIAWS